MKKRLLGLAATLLAATVLFTTPAFAASSWLEGRPSLLTPGADLGYYFWHDGAGLHLWTTGPGPQHDFTGQLVTDGVFTDVMMQRPEGDDSSLDQGGHVLRFHFQTWDGIDGLNFRIAGGDELTLVLNVDGHPITAGHVYVGAADAHPAFSTFTVHRIGP